MPGQKKVNPLTLVPSFAEVMENSSSDKGDTYSFKELPRDTVYAVIGKRFADIYDKQVLIVKLWHPKAFLPNRTGEVWSVKVLTDMLSGSRARKIPFWIAVPEERSKSRSGASFYGIKAMDLTDEQMNAFEWARVARDFDWTSDDGECTPANPTKRTSSISADGEDEDDSHNVCKRLKF